MKASSKNYKWLLKNMKNMTGDYFFAPPYMHYYVKYYLYHYFRFLFNPPTFLSYFKLGAYPKVR